MKEKSANSEPNFDTLVRLRQEKRLSQTQVAELFGLFGAKSYERIGEWEKGQAPAARHRQRFIEYLVYDLGLKDNSELFETLWAFIMQKWGWYDLSEKDRAKFFIRDDNLHNLSRKKIHPNIRRTQRRREKIIEKKTNNYGCLWFYYKSDSIIIRIIKILVIAIISSAIIGVSVTALRNLVTKVKPSWTIIIIINSNDPNDPLLTSEELTPSKEISYLIEKLTNTNIVSNNVKLGVLYINKVAGFSKKYTIYNDQFSVESGDSNRDLGQFIKWGHETLKSDRYILSIVSFLGNTDLSSSPLFQPEQQKITLTINDIYAGLSVGTSNSSWKFDIIHYDIPSFATLEILSISANYSNYVIASPSSEFSNYPYDEYITAASNSSLTEQYINSVIDIYAKNQTGDYVISSFNMKYFSEFIEKFEKCSVEVLAFTLANNDSTASDIRNRSVEYWGTNEYIDIGYILQLYRKYYTDEAIKRTCFEASVTLEKMIFRKSAVGRLYINEPITQPVKEFSLEFEVSGISIFYPLSRSDYYNKYIEGSIFPTIANWRWLVFLDTVE
jgi:transcriptional regulator with XRE-family HTH domain